MTYSYAKCAVVDGRLWRRKVKGVEVLHVDLEIHHGVKKGKVFNALRNITLTVSEQNLHVGRYDDDERGTVEIVENAVQHFEALDNPFLVVSVSTVEDENNTSVNVSIVSIKTVQ